MAANHVRLRALSAALGALALDACSPKRPSAAPEPVADAPAASAPAATKPASGKLRRPRPVVDSAALERALVSRHAHAPLARALVQRNASPEMADRIAEAVVRE